MFFKNFNKAGPGISKDAPKKVGFALFIEIFIREFWTLIVLNLVFVFTCIPVVTIGSSISALNHVFAKMMRDEPIDTISDYKHAFKINAKQGIFLGIIVFLIFYILANAFLFYKMTLGYAAYAFLALIAFVAILNVYIFPLSANVNLSIRAIFKNSALLFGICPIPTLKAFVINTAIVGASLYFFNAICGLYYLVFGFSFIIFINSFFAYPQIEKYALSTNVTDIEISEQD